MFNPKSIEEIKSYGLSSKVEEQIIKKFLEDHPEAAQISKQKKSKGSASPKQISATDVAKFGDAAKKQIEEQLKSARSTEVPKPNDEFLAVDENAPTKLKKVKLPTTATSVKDTDIPKLGSRQIFSQLESKIFAKLFPNVNKMVKFLKSFEEKDSENQQTTDQAAVKNSPIVNGLTQVNQSLNSLNNSFTDIMNNDKQITVLLEKIFNALSGRKTGGETGGGGITGQDIVTGLEGGSLLKRGLGFAARGIGAAARGISTGVGLAADAATTGLAAIGGGSALVGGGILAGAAGIAGLSYLGSKAEESGAAQKGRERVRKEQGSGIAGLDLKALGDVPNPASPEAQKLSYEKAQAYIMSFTDDQKIIERWLNVWKTVKDLPELTENAISDVINKTPVLKNYDSPELREVIRPLAENYIIKTSSMENKNSPEQGIEREAFIESANLRGSSFILRDSNGNGTFKQGVAYDDKGNMIPFPDKSLSSNKNQKEPNKNIANPEEQKDERTFMERNLPSWLGGKESPEKTNTATASAPPTPATPDAKSVAPPKTGTNTATASTSSTPATPDAINQNNTHEESLNIAGTEVKRGDTLTDKQMSAINMSVKMGNKYPEWLMKQYNKQKKDKSSTSDTTSTSAPPTPATPAAKPVAPSPKTGTNVATASASSTPATPAAKPVAPSPKTGTNVATASAAYDQSKRPPPPVTSSSSVSETGTGGGSSNSTKSETSTSDPGNVEPIDAAIRYKELFGLGTGVGPGGMLGHI